MSLIQGVVTGTVTKIDEEIPGRIKVRFNAHEETHETDWIRIATTMGGKNRGTFFMLARDRSFERHLLCAYVGSALPGCRRASARRRAHASFQGCDRKIRCHWGTAC